MNPTTYSFTAPRRARQPRTRLYLVMHNGEPTGDEHLTLRAAWERAWELSESFGTDINCFGVRVEEIR